MTESEVNSFSNVYWQISAQTMRVLTTMWYGDATVFHLFTFFVFLCFMYAY